MSEHNKIRSRIKRLSRIQIEQKVREVLDYLLPDRCDNIGIKYLRDIKNVLESKYYVTFDFTKELGSLPLDRKVFGCFSAQPFYKICIDPCLEEWGSRFCYTLAHEIGHLVLHRKYIGSDRYISRDKRLVDTAIQLRYRELAELSDLGWVEWQANEFAMAMILPRRLLTAVVIQIQIKLGIARNLGTMRLDDQTCNKIDCHRIVLTLAKELKLNPAMIWRRLRFLDILQDHRKNRTMASFNEFDTLFHSG